MYLKSSDLELVYDAYNSAGNQHVGIRFTGISIPQGATITNAYIRFTVDEADSDVSSLTITGEAVDNSSTFTTSTGNISGRNTTSASVAWAPGSWTSVGSSGSNQQTPNLESIVQEIVNRGGWSSGNAMSFVITGSGTRTAESYNGSSSAAPLLHVEYQTGSGAREIVTLSMEESTETEVKLGPNPITSTLNVSSNSAIEELILINMNGQVIVNELPNSENTQLDMTSWAAGTYMVIIRSNGELIRKTVVKQ